MRMQAPDRRTATRLVPVAVPASMAGVFVLLRERLPARCAYNLGFGVYWVGWCFAFPTWVMGPAGVWRLLSSGRRPTTGERILMGLPLLGGAAVALAPHRSRIDPRLLLVMGTTAVANAVGEELLWRGVFVDQFPDDPAQGAAWPLLGFAAWHLAPQLILPSAHGRLRFVLGSALVGVGSTATAWRGRGLRHVLLAHVLTDACGVTAAEFRLGRSKPGRRRARFATPRWWARRMPELRWPLW